MHALVLKGMIHFSLRYAGDGKLIYVGGRKSTLICFFSFGLGVIFWFSSKHGLVELEYMEASIASCETIWICTLVAD